MKNDKDTTINENEKKAENFEGVIIKDRATLCSLIEKAGNDTIDALYKGKVFDVGVAQVVAHALGVMSYFIENYIMPEGIEEK